MSIAEFYMENGLGEDYDIDDWLRDQQSSARASMASTTTFGSTEHEARSGILTRTASQYSIIFVTQNGRMVIGMHITHSLPPGTYKAHNSSTPACGASSQHAMREAVSDAAAMSPSFSSSSFSSTLLFDLPP